MAVITFIRTYLFKLLNFLLGKTKIFVIILGWFLVISGIFMLASPERARRKLVGMGFGPVKWILLILALYLVSLLSLLSANLGPLIFIAGIIAVIIAYYSFKKKSYNKIQELFAKIPVNALRVFAVIQIAVGAFMLIFIRRIWF